MTRLEDFKTGDRVRHTLRDEWGTVEIVQGHNGEAVVKVTYDKPTPKGSPSVGLYAADWFWLCPDYLRHQ